MKNGTGGGAVLAMCCVLGCLPSCTLFVTEIVAKGEIVFLYTTKLLEKTGPFLHPDPGLET